MCACVLDITAQAIFLGHVGRTDREMKLGGVSFWMAEGGGCVCQEWLHRRNGIRIKLCLNDQGVISR